MPHLSYNEFAAQWLNDNLTVASILATPGVAALLLEDNANEIQEDFDALDNEDCRCECGRKLMDCATYEDKDAEHGDRDRPESLERRKQNFGQDDRDPMHSGA